MLSVDWVSHATAERAVMLWHYSRRMPVGKLVKVGAWEDGAFIGAVLFGRGANNKMGAAFSLSQTECVELVRVALTKHVTPVSKIVAVALRFLAKRCPGLKAVISYADPKHGHVGGVYQAGGWIYTGKSSTSTEYFIDGRWMHGREATSGAFGKKTGSRIRPTTVKRTAEGKYRYIKALDRKTAERLSKFAKPYPKHARAVKDSAGVPLGETFEPIHALQEAN